MSLLAEAICGASERTMAYAERLLTGITPETAARFPLGANGPINTNHPTFIYGHLALYPARIMSFVQQDPAAVAVPEAWTPLFDPSAQCQDDPEGSLYPAFEDVKQAFFDTYPKACTAIRATDDAIFAAECPLERYQEAFGSNGGAVNYIMNNHLMNHFGQLSAWRRAQGLGPA